MGRTTGGEAPYRCDLADQLCGGPPIASAARQLPRWLLLPLITTARTTE